MRGAPRRSPLRDRRVWTLAAALLGLYAVGVNARDGTVLHALAVPAFALMFVYLYAFGVWMPWPGVMVEGVPIDFFAGFALFCLLVAALAVRLYDRVRG